MPIHTSVFVAGLSSPVVRSAVLMQARMFSPGRSTKQKGQRPMQKLYMRALSKRRRRYGMQNSWRKIETQPEIESAYPICVAWKWDGWNTGGRKESEGDIR